MASTTGLLLAGAEGLRLRKLRFGDVEFLSEHAVKPETVSDPGYYCESKTEQARVKAEMSKPGMTELAEGTRCRKQNAACSAEEDDEFVMLLLCLHDHLLLGLWVAASGGFCLGIIVYQYLYPAL
jgi:hypothetical protein